MRLQRDSPTAQLWKRKSPDPFFLGGASCLVEARGFEPRSETRSTTASTCVFHRLRSPAACQWTAHLWTSLLKFRRLTEDAAADYPEFSIPLKPPQEGFSMGRCNNS